MPLNKKNFEYMIIIADNERSDCKNTSAADLHCNWVQTSFLGESTFKLDFDHASYSSINMEITFLARARNQNFREN